MSTQDTIDPHLNAVRDNLADIRLQGVIKRPHYSEGSPARVRVGLARVLSHPQADASYDTYYHYGENILVFDSDGTFCWCQSLVDGYVGYVLQTEIEFDALPAQNSYIVSMGSYAYSEPDLRKPIANFLPRHSRLCVIRDDIYTRDTRYVELHDGTFTVANCTSMVPATSADIIEAAAKYLGCPYLWSGRSFFGIDCSALVQNAFFDIGKTVLRDTYMQRDSIGTRVEIDSVESLMKSDLLFIPGHVMIYDGMGNVIHADGKTMTVAKDPLVELMKTRSLSISAFNVRRPGL